MATSPLCGPFGVEFENDKCLCAAFTKPNNNGLSCVNGTGKCIPPNEGYISESARYTLRLEARSLNFVGDNLVITLEYPSILTASTIITVFSKSGSVLSSLADSISSTTLGEWSYDLDNSGSACVQLVTWKVNWQQFAPLVLQQQAGHYAFDIAATSHVIREKTHLSVRSIDVAPSILTDVVPITINMDQIISTKDYNDRVEFNLDYDVKMNYYLKKVHLDPTTLKVRAVLEHSISFPLSLISKNLVVSIGNTSVPSRSYEKVDKEDCPAKKGSRCKARTIILFHLPLDSNCTQIQLEIDLDLESKCKGVNDQTSKYLCFGLRESLKEKSVHVNLPIRYNFCPKIETTEVSVKTFELQQASDVLVNDEILQRDIPLQGKIVLNVDRIFQGSVFTMAKISSIQLVESSPNPASYEVSDVSTLGVGELKTNTNPNTIEISFSYTPSYQHITTYLQNWANGFFVQVTVEVSFYSPDGLNKKNTNIDPAIKTNVRLQLPSHAINHNMPNYIKRDNIVASSSTLKLNSDAVKKSLEEHKLAKQKIRTEKISEKLKSIEQANNNMMILVVAAVASCFIVLVVAGVVIYKWTRKNNQPAPQN